MELNEAIQLIQNDQLSSTTPSSWADLGCGSGLFTAALSHFLAEGSTIYAIDNRPPANINAVKPGINIKIDEADFVSDPFFFKELDGIVMANALHYVRDKPAFMRKINYALKPTGSLLIVEYDTDQAVPTWVPFPLSYKSLQQFFESQGYTRITKLQTHPSIYGRANIYAALIHR
jgi:trans-aconitate methyltransferase